MNQIAKSSRIAKSKTEWIRSVGSTLAVGLLLAAGSSPAWARFNPPPACNNPFTPQQEATEGAKVAAQVYQQMPVLPENDPVSRYVSQLGQHLASHAPGIKWPFSYHVVASSDINAFALPGGAIFVNLATVQAADTEAQLAGVLAHETSHVVLRHATCNMKKQQTKGIEYGLGSILSQIFLGNGAAGQIAQVGISGLQGLDYMHMSRDDEKQADLLGTDILYDTGYDPRGMPQFFEIIQAKYGAGGAQLLSDHPNPGNRTEYVNAEIATLPRNSNALVNSAAFTRIHAIAMQERTFTAQQTKDGSWKNGNYASGPGQVYNNGQNYPNNNGQYPNQNGQYPNGQNQNQNGQYGTNNSQQGGQQNGQQGGSNGQYGGQGPVALTRVQMGFGSRLVSTRGPNFTISRPANWQVSQDANGAVTLAPTGGFGTFGIAYGAVFDTLKTGGNAITDADALANATNQLAQQMVQQNSGLQQISQVTQLNINGRGAGAVELRGRSPLVENGNTIAEHDWLVTVARPDGDLSYMVFVSPERDFARLRPIFTRMMNSFQAQ